MTFRPLHDRILVRRIEAEEKTVGGIIIPEPQRKSRRKARLLPRVLARATTAVSFGRST